MKLLHTADLHLGKTLHEVSLEEQQSDMLKSIIEILSSDDYTALIIAGDVYDRSVASATSVALFSNFLTEVKQRFPTISVLIIPGNHDSALRLSYAHELLESMSIYIANDISKITTPISISHNDENVEFFLLPFLQTGAFFSKSESDENRLMTTQKEMVEEAMRQIKPHISKKTPSVLIAHLFTINGITSSTERQFIGSAELIDPEILSGFSYIALGHLHRFQKIRNNIYYSGSPLAYAFDEAKYEKYILSVEIDCKDLTAIPTVKPIPIKPSRKLNTIEGKFHDLLDTDKFNEYKDDFLEIILKDNISIQSPMQILQKKFTHLLTVKQEAFIKQVDSDIESDLQNSINSSQSIEDNFISFSNTINEETDEDEKHLFIDIYKELLSET
ncbi:MAG: exonuclease SbcCD subunit D [Treponema sp.]|nr:MAG: exonuclease SbcCD subunit D [Treponema sp.]